MLQRFRNIMRMDFLKICGRFIIFSNFIYQNFNLILEIRPWPWSATVAVGTDDQPPTQALPRKNRELSESLPMFGARLSVALVSELSQFGTCVKTLTRAWVGG
jgi:hypothetical protein